MNFQIECSNRFGQNLLKLTQNLIRESEQSDRLERFHWIRLSLWRQSVTTGHQSIVAKLQFEDRVVWLVFGVFSLFVAFSFFQRHRWQSQACVFGPSLARVQSPNPSPMVPHSLPLQSLALLCRRICCLDCRPKT